MSDGRDSTVPSRRGPRLLWLLGAMNLSVLMVPLVSLVILRYYDGYLLRQTERQLIAESAILGQAYQGAYTDAGDVGHVSAEHRPPGREVEQYTPFEPVLDVDVDVSPAQGPLRTAPSLSPDALRAAGAVEPLMRRAQTFDLSAIRILDGRGCGVATTGGEAGLCMEHLPEVARALSGHYSAVARARHSDEPEPPFGDIRRRGKLRVFTAMPVFMNGEVVGVVRASRTGLDALSSLWSQRRGLLWAGLSLFALVVLLTGTLTWTIAHPLRRLSVGASAIVAGQSARLLLPTWAPRELHVLAGAMSTMAQRLRRRATSMREFAAHVSHELKSPITAIRGATELMQDSPDMSQEQRARFLSNVAQDASRMEALVTRLLELTRIESAMDAVDAVVPLAPLALPATTRAILERYGDAITIDMDSAPPQCAVRAEDLASVLVNLVDNALHHAPGAPIHVTVDSQGQRLRIQVRDGGPGVSRDTAERMFEPFFTTARDAGGTGLGLPIVKALCERYGGRVSVESSAEGTRVTAVLAGLG